MIPQLSKNDEELNWTRIYFLILFFNGVLVFIFYLISYYFNHVTA